MKIFHIGLNKTGSRSLHAALKQLGYRSLHAAPDAVHHKVEGQTHTKEITREMLRRQAAGLPMLEHVDEYQAYSDLRPIEQHFDVLDQQYPGSKFIMLTRDVYSWLDSRKRHVERNQQNPNYHGSWLTVDMERWLDEWFEHTHRVYRYFLHRKSDLLVIDATDAGAMKKLAEFLGTTAPQNEFPHLGIGDAELKKTLPSRANQKD